MLAFLLKKSLYIDMLDMVAAMIRGGCYDFRKSPVRIDFKCNLMNLDLDVVRILPLYDCTIFFIMSG